MTIGALLAMAAHLEGKGAGVIDMAGLAQKGGPVTSHVRIGRTPSDITAIRIAASGADVVLACDMVVAGSARSLAAIDPGRTRVFINSHETYPGDFTHNPDYRLPSRRLIAAITGRAGAERTRVLEATRIATALLGDSIATNMFMLGLAYQAGAVPLAGASIERAIELNDVDVATNKAAFAWGRRAAFEPDAVADIAGRMAGRHAAPLAATLDEVIDRRVAFLTGYQNARYAARYAAAVARSPRGRERPRPAGQSSRRPLRATSSS